MTKSSCKELNVIIIGGGLGGLSCAVALRRQGHKVRIYERHNYAGEVGASLSCASNGSRWLEEWGINPLEAKPVILEKLIRHNWKTGEVVSEYDLGDYAAIFGHPYYNFHRIDIHNVLRQAAVSTQGVGSPCKLILSSRVAKVDYEKGQITLEDGNVLFGDLIVAADGIRSATRGHIGIQSLFSLSDSSCIRVLLQSEHVREAGLTDFSTNSAIEFWGGEDKFKIVLSPCSNNDVVSCYCFFEGSKHDITADWNNDIPVEKLLSCLPELDPRLKELFKVCGYDIKQWRLYIYKPLPYFFKASEDGLRGVALLGDAAHPMMPDQSQGAVAAFEDAGALGYIFSRKFNLTVEEGLKIYEMVRKPRVTRIQSASLRARENLSERIGWSTKDSGYSNKLTIEEVCAYHMKLHIDELVSKCT